VYLQGVAGRTPFDVDRFQPLKTILGMPLPPARVAWRSAGSEVRRLVEEISDSSGTPTTPPQVIRHKASGL
jgi:hypothetical protein